MPKPIGQGGIKMKCYNCKELEREARIREGEHNLRIEDLTRVAETNRLRAEALETALRKLTQNAIMQDGRLHIPCTMQALEAARDALREQEASDEV